MCVREREGEREREREEIQQGKGKFWLSSAMQAKRVHGGGGTGVGGMRFD